MKTNRPTTGDRIMKRIISSAIVCIVGLLLATGAHATIIQITGGDAGEGFTVPGAMTPVMAVDLVSDGAQTVQGLTFAPLNYTGTPPSHAIYTAGGVTLDEYNASEYYSWGNPFTSGTANDLAMGNILNGGFYEYYFPPMTLTYSGLTPNALYQLNLFSGSLGQARTIDLTINGINVTNFHFAASEFYNFEYMAQATSGGTLTVSAVGNGSSEFANFTAAALFASPVPEPSTLLLIGLGGLLLWFRRTRRISGQ